MSSASARNWQLVRHTEVALRTGNESLGNVPALLRSLLEEQAWREFVLPAGEVVAYKRFSDFVKARPPRGLGTEEALIERLVGTHDPDLLVLLHEAEKVGKPGPPAEGEMRGESSAISDDQTGKTAARLQRDHPEQYAAVQTGALSINAAAVVAGIRPRRFSIRADDPDSIARSLRKNLTPEAIATLRNLLDDP